MRNIFKLYRYISDLKWIIAGSAILSIASGLLGAALPFTYKLVIDSIVAVVQHPGTHLNDSINWALGLMIGVSLAVRVFDYFSNKYSVVIRERVDASLRERIFAHLMKLSVDYYEKNKVGEIVQRVNLGLRGFSFVIEQLISTPLTQLATLLTMMFLIWHLNVWAGLVATLTIPYNALVAVRRLRQLKTIRKQANEASEKMYGHFNETISHFATIKTTTDDAQVVKKYNNLSQQVKSLDILRFAAFWRSLAWRGVVNDIAQVTAIGIIGYGASRGANTIGDILLISLYMQRISGAIPSLVRLAEDISEQETSSERLIEMLETEPTVQDSPSAKTIRKINSIEFKDVSFTYPGKRRKVLSNISFHLEPGQSLALVGPSGTGKTTITKLLLRFYEPTAGQIFINGQPIENFKQDSLRSLTGVVMQEVALFNDTVTANLLIANSRANDDTIKAAARKSHADQFINKLEDKYDTLVGERGVKLSGGEKQRVAIARAILKDPQLIILDEATSALDSESEHHVQEGLRQLMHGRSSVIIAHRLSTVMKADKILVLKDGKIVESGNHQDLANKKGGLYSKLFKLQTEGYLKT